MLRDSVAIPERRERQGPDALSKISAFAVSPTGIVAVADNRLQVLRAYRLNGELLAEGTLQTSRAGDRVAANALAVDEQGRIHVYDQLSQSVHRFVQRGRALAEEHQFPTGVRGVKICSFGGHTYLLGFRDGRVVHQFNARGNLIRSFGNPLGSTPAAAEAIVAAGSSFVCIPEKGLVLIAHNVAPMVDAFDSVGRHLWRFMSPGFRQLPIRTGPDGSVSFSRGREPVDVVRSVFFAGPDHVAVQVARGGRPDSVRSRSWTLETTYVRLADGSPLGAQTDLVDVAGATASVVLTASATEIFLVAWQYALRSGTP